MARRRKDQASLDVQEAIEASSVDAAVEPVMEDVVEAAPPAPVAAPTKWMVMEDTVVSLFGQMTTMPAGTVISAASYGPSGIKRIMEQKVALEPVA